MYFDKLVVLTLSSLCINLSNNRNSELQVGNPQHLFISQIINVQPDKNPRPESLIIANTGAYITNQNIIVVNIINRLFAIRIILLRPSPAPPRDSCVVYSGRCLSPRSCGLGVRTVDLPDVTRWRSTRPASGPAALQKAGRAAGWPGRVFWAMPARLAYTSNYN